MPTAHSAAPRSGLEASRASAHRYGEKWLFSVFETFHAIPPPTAGTYLHVNDRSGRIDTAFAAPQGSRWRSPDAPGAVYSVAADGAAHVVMARGTDRGIRVLRYRDLRGVEPAAEPVSTLSAAVAALLAVALLLLGRRRLRAG